MKALRHNEKLNNKGLSLVEVLVALAISGIVMVVIFAFISSGTRFFNKQNNSINLQNELTEVSNSVSDALMQATALEIATSTDQLTIHTGEYALESGKYVFTTGKGAARLIYWNGSSVYIMDKPSDAELSESELEEGYCYSHYVSSITVNISDRCKVTGGAGVIYYSQPLMVDVTVTVSNNGVTLSDTKTTTIRNTIKNMKIGSDIYTYRNGFLQHE